MTEPRVPDPEEPPLEWAQSFRWGLLTVLDPGSAWELPDLAGPGPVHVTPSCVAAAVLHASEREVAEDWPDDLPVPDASVTVVVTGSVAPPEARVDLDHELACPSGQLEIGDAELSTTVDVTPGVVRLQLTLFPREHADAVVVRLLPGSTF